LYVYDDLEVIHLLQFPDYPHLKVHLAAQPLHKGQLLFLSWWMPASSGCYLTAQEKLLLLTHLQVGY